MREPESYQTLAADYERLIHRNTEEFDEKTEVFYDDDENNTINQVEELF